MLATMFLAAEAAESSETVTNPILPAGSELFWGAVFFFLLWILMRYVLLPPVLKVMDERESRLRAARAEAETATSGAGEVRAAYNARLAEARTEAAAIIGAARDDADRYRAQQLAAANAEIATLRESASAEVAQAKAVALAQLRTQVAGVAVQAASRVVQKDLDLDRQLQVIEDYVNGAGNGAGN